ncbi:hypothetical protein ACFPOD_16755 [Nitratireductor kimnyeongensis]|uniref:Uncharacterized protein n=1 Tax=Nitratireductor kimnyeongensis TaxID=430679 RepID=A0ABW0TBW6_9HYPH|nr:hypothetical protein [Nitratireductor kimnyeongensis]QZZ37018.1 hypothetical protein KW403_07840 [Nitratireductor kimnyeongensis]
MSLSIMDRPAAVDTRLHLIIGLAIAAAFALQTPLFAQGLQREEAIDAIVGSEVKTEEVEADAASSRILAAIDATAQNAERVRKTFSLDEIDIVFLPDLEEKDGSIASALVENEDEIAMLREAIEGSALFFHAVDSRSIQLRDVVALEYAERGGVTIFVKGGANRN